MGRRKPGKPRRQEQNSYTLRQLQPPGYDEWVKPGSDLTARGAADDPRLGREARDILHRVERLMPTYQGLLPMQAVQLDMMLDKEAVPFCYGEERFSLIPLQEVAKALSIEADADVRASFHQLHAAGALLIEERDDVSLVRIVSQRPTRPGDPWAFQGGPEEHLVPKTCVPAQPGELSADEFAALAFVRMHMSEGTEPDPADFARHEGIGSVERASQLFAAVAERAQVRGCSACPTAHLCTRVDEEGRS
jgi:hypothetical protein